MWPYLRPHRIGLCGGDNIDYESQASSRYSSLDLWGQLGGVGIMGDATSENISASDLEGGVLSGLWTFTT